MNRKQLANVEVTSIGHSLLGVKGNVKVAYRLGDKVNSYLVTAGPEAYVLASSPDDEELRAWAVAQGWTIVLF